MLQNLLNNHKSKILSITGAIFLGITALLLEITVLAGIFSTLGFLLLICAGRWAEKRSDIILNVILLWLGHTIRFCGIFGTDILYTFFCSLLLIPYCILLAAALFPDRILQKAGHPFLATLILPATYSLCAFLLATLNLGFTFNITSYIMCIPVVAVNLSFLGEYLLTFVLMWILVCLSEIISAPGKKVKIILGAVSVFLSLTLITSGIILRSQRKWPDYTIKVALATSLNWNASNVDESFYSKERQLEIFESEMKQASEEGAELLILNEENFFCKEENTETMLEEISKIIQNYGIPTLVGLGIVCENDLDINEALFFDGNGQILYTYVKNNLVPFVEAGYYVDGPEEPAVLETTIGGHTVNLAFVICYDINDEMYLRKIPSDTELLIVPSWDWDTVNFEQKRTSIRSATLNLTLVKHSFDGFSYVSCPNGDYMEEVDFRDLYETVKIVDVPIWEK